jgi:catalase
MCKEKIVRQQVVDMLANIDLGLAQTVAQNVGVHPPSSFLGPSVVKSSPALSQENTVKKPDTRKIAVLAGEGYHSELPAILEALKKTGMQPVLVSEQQGMIEGEDGSLLEVDHTFLTSDSVLFDAVYAVGGSKTGNPFIQDAGYFIKEAFSHFKPIGVSFHGKKLLENVKLPDREGVMTSDSPSEFLEEFTKAVAEHRFWNRKMI